MPKQISWSEDLVGPTEYLGDYYGTSLKVARPTAVAVPIKSTRIVGASMPSTLYLKQATAAVVEIQVGVPVEDILAVGGGDEAPSVSLTLRSGDVCVIYLMDFGYTYLNHSPRYHDWMVWASELTKDNLVIVALAREIRQIP